MKQQNVKLSYGTLFQGYVCVCVCVCVYACAHVWCTEKGYGLVYHGEKYLKSIDLNDFFKIVFLTLQSSRKGA